MYNFKDFDAQLCAIARHDGGLYDTNGRLARPSKPRKNERKI